MSVMEKLANISDTVTKLITYTTTDEIIKSDFDEYLTAIGAKKSNVDVQTVIIPYIFERRLTKEKKSIIDLYLEKNIDIQEEEKNILMSLTKSFSSVFEVRRILSSGFELYNLVNEKLYKVLTLVKMNNFRGVTPGQFLISRIFPYNKEYYLLEISNVIPSYNAEEVYKYAIAKIIETPESAYENNEKKQQQIDKIVSDFAVKFQDCFNSNEVITTNKYADNLINLYNSYCDEGILPSKEEIESNIKNVENNRYFTVSDFKNSYSDFMEKSLEGFSSHSSTYDIGIIYDKELGLFVVPFYQTMCKIYEVEDYKTIQGYKDCVKSFLENDKIPANIIKLISSKYPNFIDRTNEILSTSYSFDELLNFYKSESIEKKIYSSASVLYASKVFEQMMNSVNSVTKSDLKEGVDYSKVGRNDPCPCGSGKKFKKCCMLKLQKV